ncbi:hypothetical protein [Deinococcus peraridilitoris]|uniref:Uncharacterized protein n=1 Tax=Deinococcus peraridilitoris (strain DSM 19664 / LMG 22246 / CIP 109416 / KR-200) TaxID=937777 RepID=K9ZWL8_DEIPD|nr:hypothetical protein [Deinococcus peraridilitoris]AFZ66043.1 hypothetical protein Deipe_0446 [Deinococcus peraridilitoris DSM 19664]
MTQQENKQAMTPAMARELLENATPGPWSYDRPSGLSYGDHGTVEEYAEYYEIQNENCTVVASLAADHGDVRLLASAPDLARLVIEQARRISSLEASLLAICGTDTTPEYTGPHDDHLTTPREIARSALGIDGL